MKYGWTRLVCTIGASLLAACDGGGYRSVTAPEPPPAPAPSAVGTYAGSSTIAGVGSHDPAGDCVADAVGQGVGQAWSFRVELTEVAGGFSGEGQISTPLLGSRTCRLDPVPGGSRDVLVFNIAGGCELTYGSWTYGAGCSPANAVLRPYYVTIPKPARDAASGAVAIAGTAVLTFERYPFEPYDLDVVLDVRLEPQ